MKKLFIAAALLMSTFFAKAQSFNNGDIAVNIGFGLGYTYDYYGYNTTSWPTLHISAEKGISDIENIGVLSIGGFLSFKHLSINDYYGYGDYGYSNTYVGGRGIIHFNGLGIDKLDIYGGLGLGLRFNTEPDWNVANHHFENSTSVGPYVGFFGGGRYFLNQNLALFGELGYDAAWLKFGLSFKL